MKTASYPIHGESWPYNVHKMQRRSRKIGWDGCIRFGGFYALAVLFRTVKMYTSRGTQIVVKSVICFKRNKTRKQAEKHRYTARKKGLVCIAVCSHCSCHKIHGNIMIRYQHADPIRRRSAIKRRNNDS